MKWRNAGGYGSRVENPVRVLVDLVNQIRVARPTPSSLEKPNPKLEKLRAEAALVADAPLFVRPKPAKPRNAKGQFCKAG